ncbi:MAG: hypothetical protein DIU65_09670, partial [Proteobacteria bacterium]
YGTTAKRRSKFDIVLPHWKFIHPMRTAPLCQEKTWLFFPGDGQKAAPCGFTPLYRCQRGVPR